MASRIYLDWAAAAPIATNAKRAFERALALTGNPSSPHEEGRQAKAVLEDARTRIARLAGTKSEAVIFTAGATEANALGIEGHIDARIALGIAPEKLHVLYLPSSHASVLGAMRRLELKGVASTPLRLIEGKLDCAHLKSAVRPETVLVVLDLVCGETGMLYDVRDARRALDTVRKGIAIHADASQAPFVSSFSLTHLGADSVALDAQKVGGVRGIGCLIVPTRHSLRPLIEGGGQERGLRPGTESPALASAFAIALEEVDANRDTFITRSHAMRATLLEKLKGIPAIEVNEGKEQASHILNLSFIGRDTDYLAALLDEKGIAVSTKSACESDSEEGSRAVFALTGDASRAQSTLRISWGPTTRERDLTQLAKKLNEAVRFLDANAI